MRHGLIALGDKVPPPAPQKLGKEPAGVLCADYTSMFRQADKGQPFAIALPEETFPLRLLKECEQP